MANLQDENVGLRRQIREHEERAADRQNYVRKQVGSATVWIRQVAPDTYYCPNCFAQGKIVQLSQLPSSGVSHLCPACHFLLGG